MMTWFFELTGCEETSPDDVRRQLWVEGDRLHSRANGKSWRCGTLRTPSLAELRQDSLSSDAVCRPNTVREVVANVQSLHCDPAHQGALFQVASQFNLLEMTSPRITPEAGVGIYEHDLTQGPACAIAAGAGTIQRNYFACVNGRIGQSADNQIDCLAEIATLLDNSHQRLWQMSNGYALPSSSGLSEISRRLQAMDESARDAVRQALRIGLQLDTQVTLQPALQTVSQAYCSALPVAYTPHPQSAWAPFASVVLEAAYEATVCAAVVNFQRTGCNRLFLTLLGGGVFGNAADWIFSALRRALQLYSMAGLDVAIVSYGHSNPAVRSVVNEFA
ncbi:MAG: hypothetical protein ACKO2P_11325 [Planctomycetota bacterium]